MDNQKIYEEIMNYLLACDPRNSYDEWLPALLDLQNYLFTTDFKKFDWDYQSSSHRKPLIFEAASNGLTPIVNFIITMGADIEAKNWTGGTALSIAAENGYYDIAALLLKHGANVNTVNSRNITPLYKAVISGHFNLVTLLLEFGADTDIASKGEFNGETPIKAAIRLGYSDIQKAIFNSFVSKLTKIL